MLSQPTIIPSHLPIFPLTDQVVFPHMLFPLFLNAEEVMALEELLQEDRLIGLAFALNENRTGFNGLARVGTVCRVNKIVRFPDGGCKIMVEGLLRIRLLEPLRSTPVLVCRVEVVEEPESGGLVAEALVQSVNSLLKIALAYGRPLPGDVIRMIDQIEEPGRLADMVAVYLHLETARQQHLLEIFDPLERLKEVYLHLTSEVQKLQVRGDVQSEVVKRLGKTQKEYLLREQLKQIQSELGDEDPRQSEIKEIRARIKEADMPEAVQKVAEKELGRLERINPASPEYTVARTYLDYLCNAPWARHTDDSLDIRRAQAILDEDHYDLTEVKERILECLAVRSLRKTTKGPILCFVGPPGVGKTSLGRSIARAMGRRFIRMSLGGMRDEAEIRGHRRTYIGALPGRIIQELCRAEANNPVFMLDEVDKIGQDFRGDPASALLEVLDPEQNNSFVDHYLDVPFDLSNVMFITTANILDPVPHALKDRMEVIRLSGYGDEEKVQIAFKYLVPKQLEENALADRPVEFSREAILKMIQEYTREAGVRNLERQIASICRKVAKEIAKNESAGKSGIGPGDVQDMLGSPKFFADVAGEEDRVGVVTGLAWTEAGGDIIFVEVSRMPGKKDLILTGSLGEVMQESAKTALSYVRAHAVDLGIDPGLFENCDIHVHVPAGAIPKDGPSAGITIAAALISLFSGRPARRDVALTGELTLSGRILPIGGIKEKVLAAQRAGVATVLLPRRNEGSLRDLDQPVLEKTDIRLVDSMPEVVALILQPRPGEPDRYRPAGTTDSSSFTGSSPESPPSP